MKYFTFKQTVFSVTVLSSCLGVTIPVSAADSLQQAFSSGKADINMRYRYETVKAGSIDGNASTLRTRLGFTTGDYNNLKARIDLEYVNTGGNYDDANPRPTIADPQLEELNQAWIDYTGIDKTSIKVGRQRIILDNARFVGNVGWRQAEQTFDAITITNKSFGDTTITFSNISQINTITGGEVNTSHNIFNVGVDKTPIGKVSAYAYVIDNDAPDSTSDITTLGARLKDAKDNLLYTLEYAQQSDSGDSTADFSPTYTFLEAGYKMGDTKVFLAQETLGSDNGVGFSTPLATKHAFNGWADQFLGTPGSGLTDLYLKAVTKVAGMKLVGVYHDFSADTGSTDFGTELDLLLVKPINKNMKALIKFSDFDADASGGKTDTQKIWLALEARFSQ